jgi:hypothetical protein
MVPRTARAAEPTTLVPIPTPPGRVTKFTFMTEPVLIEVVTLTLVVETEFDTTTFPWTVTWVPDAAVPTPIGPGILVKKLTEVVFAAFIHAYWKGVAGVPMSEVPLVTTPRFERNREGVPRTASVPLMVVFP